jgi:hypothetical protein
LFRRRRKKHDEQFRICLFDARDQVFEAVLVAPAKLLASSLHLGRRKEAFHVLRTIGWRVGKKTLCGESDSIPIEVIVQVFDRQYTFRSPLKVNSAETHFQSNNEYEKC